MPALRRATADPPAPGARRRAWRPSIQQGETAEGGFLLLGELLLQPADADAPLLLLDPARRLVDGGAQRLDPDTPPRPHARRDRHRGAAVPGAELARRVGPEQQVFEAGDDPLGGV